ncbi:ABC transporter permease [Deinococcus sp. Arct2-2]|uniref:ABC transporter permease n=1 Tax=Deinococcus sp. Arct2-2 TaxID=2568653 RepID=UPI0010A5861D|nr:ABC transporter permease [Deinococcus sp. Arct2-2]THF71766.1 ABC transporter permease [Deinococcus sp. Arct2-2]
MTAVSAPAGVARVPSPLALAWRRYRKSRLGVVGGWMLLILYLVTLFSPFLAPYSVTTQHEAFSYQAPQAVHMVHKGKLSRPFVYGVKQGRDPVTFARTNVIDRENPVYISLFVRGEPYRMLGIPATVHLFGVPEGQFFFPLGTDLLGRDLLSRMLVGGQVSLTVGVLGVVISFGIGIVMGGLSGYYGGRTDDIIQRVVEVLLSFPRLPILLAISVLVPARWPSTWVYAGIVAVLAMIGWASVARVVRGQVLAARQLEYVAAAQALGVRDLRVILRHVIPNLSSFLIVSATLALPGYIIGESTLSFLGVGIKEPMTSWGLLLKEANNFETLAGRPWLLAPGLLIFLSVLAFNFFGDALRDAADTQSR